MEAAGWGWLHGRSSFLPDYHASAQTSEVRCGGAARMNGNRISSAVLDQSPDFKVFYSHSCGAVSQEVDNDQNKRNVSSVPSRNEP